MKYLITVVFCYKKFSSYVGLIPGESSSGNKARYLSVTKQDNSTISRILIECAQTLVKNSPGIKSKVIKQQKKGQNAAVIEYADRVVERLQKISQNDVSRNKQK